MDILFVCFHIQCFQPKIVWLEVEIMIDQLDTQPEWDGYYLTHLIHKRIWILDKISKINFGEEVVNGTTRIVTHIHIF